MYLSNAIETPHDRRWLEYYYDYYSALCKVSAQFFGPGDTENQDAVQNVYVKLAGRPKFFRAKLSHAGFLGYLKTMTRNASRDLLRRRSKLSEAATFEDEDLGDDPVLYPPGRGFAEQFADKALVRGALESLPVNQQMALILHFVFQLTVKQTAWVMDRKVPNTKQIIDKGRNRMVQLLAKEAAV